MGAKGMPRRYATYLEEFQIFHIISTVGTWVMALGFITLTYLLIHSLIKGKQAPDNPWGATTLEWQTTSPPDEHNFHEIPKVTNGPYHYEHL